MCELYVRADPIHYESRSRSLRIHGVVTTIRLENMFWDVLTEIAAVDQMTVNQLITKLYDEVMEVQGELPNMASFLRVSCLRYMNNARKPTDTSASARPVMLHPVRTVGK